MVFANADLDDLVILRSDGSPIYNLAVVSDDARQRITHVIRGDDHLSNTPKQIQLYRALGLPEPTFGHVPMILGPDGKRLSKRHGATAVADYERQGILPEAMVNFLALLGWNPGDEREVMERAELVEAFSMARVQKKSAVFDHAKLEWLNGHYLARTPTAELVSRVVERLGVHGVAPETWTGRGEAWLLELVDLLKVRARTVDDLAAQAVPYLVDEPEPEGDAVARHWSREPGAVQERLHALRDRLSGAAWTEAALEETLRALAGELGIGAGKLIHPLRVALTGRSASPGIFEVLVLLGPERALQRVDLALARIEAMHKTLS
jgi:glutamyl-tRNA synthetase